MAKRSGFIFFNDKLFVTLEFSSLVSVFNSIDYSHLTDINLNDGSATPFAPNAIIQVNGKLYVSNGKGLTLAEIDPVSLSVTNYFNIGEAVSGLEGIEGNNDNIYLLSVSARKLDLFSISNPANLNSIALTDIPRGFAGISDGADGSKRAYVSNVGGKLDLVDITNMVVIDQQLRSPQESFATKEKFVDVLPKSSPKLVDVTTVDGLAESERWVLTFNGIVSGTYSEDGTISGTNLNDGSGQFLTLGVAAGDVLVINPYEGEKEEVKIHAVLDDQNIVISNLTVNSGANIKYYIRSDGNYIVYGSSSGLQLNRLLEGTPYTTDTGSLSMNVVTSLDEPTTEGDYFTFLTDSGVDSTVLSRKMLPYHMTDVFRQSDGYEYIYVANEGSNNISVVDVKKLREAKTIN